MSLMSKESPRLILSTLVASAAAATVMTLSGCSEEPKIEASTYRNVGECMADGHASNLCSAALQRAKADAVEATPVYESKQDCEEDWGGSNCADTAVALADQDLKPELDEVNAAAPVHSGGGFSPFFWGYMLGHNNGSYYSQPVYRGADQAPRLASGFAVPVGKGAVPASAFNKMGAAHFARGSSMAATARAAAVTAPSVKSGGFGSVGRAGGFSSGG